MSFGTRVRRALSILLSGDGAGVTPVPRTELSRAETRDALAADLAHWDSLRRLPADGTYYAPDPADVADVVETHIRWLPYQSPEWDCEDYAKATAVAAIFSHGITTVGRVVDTSASVHSYNIVIDSEQQVWVYEPNALNGIIVPREPVRATELPLSDAHRLESGTVIL